MIVGDDRYEKNNYSFNNFSRKLCKFILYGTKCRKRIRTRFNQSNALWTMDGDKLLEEGNAELTSLREDLVANANLMIPLD